MVEIKGLEKLAPKDFPGHISATVFLGGCNFRCPFCHNRDLVLHPEKMASFPLDYFTSFLDSREGWLEGICITGGEPLFHKDLEVLLKLIRERKLKIKLDTNGSYPGHLEEVLNQGLLDSVAMDIKAAPEDYSRAGGIKINMGHIRRSVDLIHNSGVDAVFRTTAVPDFINSETVKKICDWLPGDITFQLQQFAPGNSLNQKFDEITPYAPSRIRELAGYAETCFSEVRIEGI